MMDIYISVETSARQGEICLHATIGRLRVMPKVKITTWEATRIFPDLSTGRALAVNYLGWPIRNLDMREVTNPGPSPN
jgi:hypothetical protein